MEQSKVLSSWNHQGKSYQAVLRKVFFFKNDMLEERVEVSVQERKGVLFLRYWKDIKVIEMSDEKILLEKNQENESILNGWLLDYGMKMS